MLNGMDDVTTYRRRHAEDRGLNHCNRFAYFGTAGKPDSARPSAGDSGGEPCGVSWSTGTQRTAPQFLSYGDGIEILIRSECAVFLRGYAVGGPTGLTNPDAQGLLARVLDKYLQDGQFTPEQYDGSFTLVLLDGRNGRVEMFRNLVGNTFTYYCEVPEGLVFGSNLAEVARRSGLPLRPDPEMLPVYFIYRFVSGGNTLFRGIKRLQPGERVSYQDGRLSVKQIQTFADFDEPRKTGEGESIERVEATMAEVVGNLMDIAPASAGLLSGGVDSTYIQAHWNKLWRTRNGHGKPRSAAVWLDHPATAPDQEYASSAARELDTDHLALRLTGLDARQMSETLSAVGEMPNHVQSFYFGPLARAMADSGITAGLCGEGADGLFGNSGGDELLSAQGFCKRFPTRVLRALGALVSQGLGHIYAAHCFRLSNRLHDTTSFLHPINSAAAFTNWDLVSACFGFRSASKALVYRQGILRRFRVPEDGAHLQRALAIGYLAEAVNTASYWNQLAANSEIEFLCPFLDSRILRAATNIDLNARFVPGNPKQVLKKSLARHVPEGFVNRPKRGFGQPIFEWLAEGGMLRGAVEKIGGHEFLDKKTLQRAKARPDWFLYNLLIYDLWHKAFMENRGT